MSDEPQSQEGAPVEPGSGDSTDGDKTSRRARKAAKRLRHAQRRAQALRLYLKGKTYEEIGEVLDISKQSAHRLISRTLAAIYRAPVEEVRNQQLARYTRLLEAVWDGAIGDNPKAPDQVDDVLHSRAESIMKRLDKLHGLEAAEKVEVTGGRVTLEVRNGELVPAVDEEDPEFLKRGAP